jgi:uncharacterized protein (TIGR00369 family)
VRPAGRPRTSAEADFMADVEREHARPMSDGTSAAIPAGFKPVVMTLGGSFVAANGPLYVSKQGDTVRLGLRIEERHCSGLGMCHGGLLATFADMLMPLAMYNEAELAAAPRTIPTVSMQLDFIAPVRMGDWLEGEGQVLKVTRSLVFVQALVRVEGNVVLRCSGVYKIASELSADWPGMYIDVSPPVPPGG